jgi:hypothetical protein
VLALVVLLSDISQWLRRGLGRTTRRRRLGAWAVEYGPRALFAGAALLQMRRALVGHVTADLVEDLVLGANVLTVCVLTTLIYRGWPARRRLIGVTLGAAALAGVGVGGGLLAGRWHEGFAVHYDPMFGANAVSRLEKLGEEGGRVCVLDYRPYPFSGSRRQISMCQPLRVTARRLLLEYYRLQGVDFVVVVVRDPFVGGRYAGLHDWHRKHPEWFEPLECGPGAWLFRVERPASEERRR